MQIEETFRAKVWTQDSTGAWHFVTLPAILSARIRTLTTGLRKPFGSFRVKAQINRELLRKHFKQVKTGLPGIAWLKLDLAATWPENLQIKVPQ